MTDFSIRSLRSSLPGLLLQGVLLLGLWSGAARAEVISRTESRAIQAAVQRQFDAFERDDAAAAFAIASTATRAQFGSAEKFMLIVKEQYRAVYRHRIAFFAVAERIEGAVLQTVRLTDADDRVWEAVYQLQREADGQWHIVGCQLVETKNVST
ncbi:MAG: DUF4864 domain-containing protein [Herminiimonas sp.]|nr:DUF4864 domain-containing protein [Herminiimonas sp.]